MGKTNSKKNTGKSKKVKLFGKKFDRWDLILVTIMLVSIILRLIADRQLSLEGMISYYYDWGWQEIKDWCDFFISMTVLGYVTRDLFNREEDFYVVIILIVGLGILKVYSGFKLAEQGMITYYSEWLWREIRDWCDMLLPPLLLGTVIGKIMRKAKE